MAILEEDVASVRAATDFVALASEHMALRRVGTQWTGLCPFHTEKSPSFSLNPELGVYYCFGCGARGDVITFVRELEHLSFVEAVERLATRAGVTLRYDDEATGRDHQRRSRIHDTLARAVAWYHDRLVSAPDAAPARRYLRAERGYDGDVVRHYQLGWAPEGWDQLQRALKLPRPALVDAGLAQANDQGRYLDFFRGRLLFPIFDPGGRAIGAGGRILPGGRGPKYKNTSGTAVYDKSKVLYGLNWAKNAIVAKDQIVVCEGYTDVIGLQLAGVGEAVATCGTALADGHIQLLTKFAHRIVLAYDADAAGQAAADRYYEWEERYGVDIRVAALPPGKDPADLARDDPQALERAVSSARPYLAFRLERLFATADLATAEGRVRAASAALGVIGTHPNELVRDQYLMEVADRCRIAPERLRSLPVHEPAGFAVRTGAGPRSGSASHTGGHSGRGTGLRNGSVSSDGAASRNGPARNGSGSRNDWATRDGSAYRNSTAARDGSSRDDGDPARADPSGSLAVRVPMAEHAALRLAVHHPDAVADRLCAPLFGHPVSRSAFGALAEAATLRDAVDAADPQAAELLSRLAVEEADDEPDDVMVRLVEMAARRALDELGRELRSVPPAEHASYVTTMAWLKRASESLR
ncbi:MAG TPA: DNA primase, partial [Acidimicrobiales bacterium]|nr:DNA primase [Acidimicrobiales bacterium]